MMKHQIYSLFGALILFTSAVIAQDYSATDIKKLTPRNYGEISNDGEITGYYLFYETDKLRKGQRAYEIKVLDANLKEISEESFVQGKKTYMLEAAYNGKSLLFKFFDKKNKEVIYRVMDSDGEMSDGVTREASKLEMKTYMTSLRMSQDEFYNVSSPNSKGFVDVYIAKDATTSYKVSYIDNAGEVEWTYSPDVSNGNYAASYMTASNSQILIMETSAKSAFDKDLQFALRGISYDGEENFHVPLTSQMFNLMPHNAFVQPDGSGFSLIGEHFSQEDKMLKAESQGVFMRDINEEGLWDDETYLNWETDIKPEMTEEQYDKARKFSVLFHDVIRTKDGNIIAVGEQYKKQVSALGVAARATGGSAALMEIRLGDMIMIHINKDRQLEAVNVFDKKNRSINVGEGYGVYNKHLLGRMLKAFGYMDYEFNQFNADKSVSTIAFTDKQKEKGKMFKQSVVQFVNFVDEDNGFTHDKITLDTEADEMWIMRGKPGYITIVEFWRREKKATWRQEVVNY